MLPLLNNDTSDLEQGAKPFQRCQALAFLTVEEILWPRIHATKAVSMESKKKKKKDSPLCHHDPLHKVHPQFGSLLRISLAHMMTW